MAQVATAEAVATLVAAVEPQAAVHIQRHSL